MKNLLLISFLLLMTSNLFPQWNYPKTRTVDSVEVYFGETLKDPYQWLENLESEEVKDWFKSEADYTDEIINKIPNRDKLVDEMTELDKVKKVKYSSITERGGRYFLEKRYPGQEIMKLFYREGINGEDILLLDPELYDAGKKYTLGGWTVSDNGKKIMINLNESGKERPFLRVLDVDSKTFYPEDIKAAYAYDWLPESDNAFMYLQLQNDDVHKMETNMDSKMMIHKMGESISKDKELLSRLHDPELKINPEDYPFVFHVSGCDYIFAGKYTVDNNQQLFYAPKSQLTSDKIDWKPLCTKSDEITSIVVHKDDVYFLTSKNAPNFKIIKTSLKNPDIANAKVILNGDDKKIESISHSKDYLIITQIYNGIETYISKMNFDNDFVESVSLPLNGSTYLTPYNSLVSNVCSVYNSNWVTPSNLYDINLENDSFDKGAFNVEYQFPGAENIVSEEIEVPSHDGVMVPLSIVYDKTQFKKDGSNICYLDGYGAYGYSINPYFNTFMRPLLKRGVVYAVAHVRGGGEKGENWYRAGWKTTKPNTWKDFIACGDYLVNNGYTSKERLAGTGASAGGILIGRAITERPDLFKAAVPMVGCLNTLRAEFSPNGPVNIPEFGTVAIEEEYKALKEMDAYEHLREGEKYPATLITTGFNDPRVISWIPAKFAAKMQNVNTSENPVLLHVDYSTGHFGGETMSDYFKNLSDTYSFILWQCGHPDFQQKVN